MVSSDAGERVVRSEPGTEDPSSPCAPSIAARTPSRSTATSSAAAADIVERRVEHLSNAFEQTRSSNGSRARTGGGGGGGSGANGGSRGRQRPELARLRGDERGGVGPTVFDRF